MAKQSQLFIKVDSAYFQFDATKTGCHFSSIRVSILSKSPIQISPFIGTPAFPREKAVS